MGMRMPAEAEVLNALAVVSGLAISTVVGPQARHNAAPIRRAAISLLRSEARLNGSQIVLRAAMFGSGASFVQRGLSDGSVAGRRQADVEILTSELHAPVSTR